VQYSLEHFGVSVAAITGVLAARGKQVDLFGVIVLALVTAFGGGSIRDVAIGSVPVFWAADPNYLINAFVTAVIVFYLVRYHELPPTLLMVADAFVLALFAVVGAQKTLTFGLAPSIAVAMGVITGVAGGIGRDLLIGEIPLVFRPHIYLYATAAFFGVSFYVLLFKWSPDRHFNMVLGTAAVLLLRLAGIRWKIALPVFRPKDTASPAAGLAASEAEAGKRGEPQREEK
jgi:uncharacterized membrane protein YeiH